MIRNNIFFLYVRVLIFIIITVFVLSVFMSEYLRVEHGFADTADLPDPTGILEISRDYFYPYLAGIKVDPRNPLNLEFLIDIADKDRLERKEALRLINYFLCGLTVPEDDLWVNLSPYELNRIIPEKLSVTEMGRDMLAQDYILKQLSSSLTHPDTMAGRAYWGIKNRELKIENALTQISTERSALSKIWIMPDIAKVMESGTMAYIKESSLKAVAESDYQGLLPAVTQQINNGKHFAKLRQIYSALILSCWFKKKFFNSFYKNYIDQNKISGIDSVTPEFKDMIWGKYCRSFEKGVYDVVRDAVPGGTRAARAVARQAQNGHSGRMVSKQRYFSGGIVGTVSSAIEISKHEFLTAEAAAAREFYKSVVTISPEEERARQVVRDLGILLYSIPNLTFRRKKEEMGEVFGKVKNIQQKFRVSMSELDKERSDNLYLSVRARIMRFNKDMLINNTRLNIRLSTGDRPNAVFTPFYIDDVYHGDQQLYLMLRDIKVDNDIENMPRGELQSDESFARIMIDHIMSDKILKDAELVKTKEGCEEIINRELPFSEFSGKTTLRMLQMYIFLLQRGLAEFTRREREIISILHVIKHEEAHKMLFDKCESLFGTLVKYKITHPFDETMAELYPLISGSQEKLHVLARAVLEFLWPSEDGERYSHVLLPAVLGHPYGYDFSDMNKFLDELENFVYLFDEENFDARVETAYAVSYQRWLQLNDPENISSSVNKVSLQEVGGIALEDIGLDVEDASSALADIDIDFSDFAGFSVKDMTIEHVRFFSDFFDKGAGEN